MVEISKYNVIELSLDEMFDISAGWSLGGLTAAVLGGAGTGAWIGGGIGSNAAVIGALPGAIGGAVVGGIVGGILYSL